MVTLEQAYKIVETHIPKCAVLKGCSEYPDFWAFGIRSRENGSRAICRPYSVSKIDGHFDTFFPGDLSPEFMLKCREVTLEELEKVMKPEDFALTKKYKERDDMEDAQLSDDD